jgi:hypothetical protein
VSVSGAFFSPASGEVASVSTSAIAVRILATNGCETAAVSASHLSLRVLHSAPIFALL